MNRLVKQQIKKILRTYKETQKNLVNGFWNRPTNFTMCTTKQKIIKLKFKQRDGNIKQVQCKVGQHILQVAKDNDIQLQGACQASLACSTCHVILPESVYPKLPHPKQEEQDLLDLAFGLTSTSRLGCQVMIDQKFQGVVVQLPKASRNLYVDGTKPKSH